MNLSEIRIKLPWVRCLAAGLLTVAVVVAHAAEYKLYYCHKEQKWMYEGGKGQSMLDGTPSLNRGDKVKLYVIQNTLRTQVKVEFEQELFASTAPEILKSLLPGGGANALDKFETDVLTLKGILLLYPGWVEELRAIHPSCSPEVRDAAANQALHSLQGKISAATHNVSERVEDDNKRIAEANRSRAANEQLGLRAQAKHLDQIRGSGPLSGRLRGFAATLMAVDPDAVGPLFDKARAMADLIEQVENGDIFKSGPYEIEPDQDLLTIKLTFTDVPAPNWKTETQPATGAQVGQVGGPGANNAGTNSGGGGDKKAADKQAAEEPQEPAGGKEVEPADRSVTKRIYLGSYGLGFAKPSYSLGLSYSKLMDVSTRKVTANSQTTVEPGAKSGWKVVPSAYMHLNVYNTPDFHFGPTLGVLYSGENLVSYFAGVSLQFGRRTRLSFNAGWQFGEVEVLDGIRFGDVVTTDQSLTRKVWRSKFLVGFSYSF